MKQFEFRKDNRKIRRVHVEAIKESIKAHGYLSNCPIILNKEGEIIDGQHRYIACTELGITPAYITIENADRSLMVDLNRSQYNWQIADFVNFYAESGNVYFKILKAFVEKSKLAITCAILILTNKDVFSGWDTVKNGKFTFKNTDKDSLNEKLRIADDINVIAKYLNLPRGNKAMTIAYLNLLAIDGFDKNYFFGKIRRYKSELSLCANDKKYLQMFVSIYNYGRKENKLTV